MLLVTAVKQPLETVAKNYILMSDQADKYNSQLARLTKNKNGAKAFKGMFMEKAPTIRETYYLIRDNPNKWNIKSYNFYRGYWSNFSSNFITALVVLMVN